MNSHRINKESLYFYGLFLINPLISLIVALINRSKNLRGVLIWFCAFYGFTFLVDRTSSDAFIHIREFQSLAENTNLGLLNYLELIYREEADLLIPLVKFFVSRFTDSPKVLLMFIGLIFGYFYARNVTNLLSLSHKKRTYFAILVLTLFSFIYAPWEINAFRFPIATHIFILGIFSLFYLKERKAWGWILLSPFVHFTFLIAVGLLVLFLIIGNRLTVYMSIFIFSLFFSGNLEVSQLLNTLPDTGIKSIEKRKVSYTDEEYITLNQTNDSIKNWYVLGRLFVLKVMVVLFSLIVFYKVRKNKREVFNGITQFLGLSLLMMSFSNLLAGQVASIGRFLNLGQMIFLLSLFLYAIHYSWRPNVIYSTLFTACVLLYVVVDVRIGFYSISLDTVLSNPIIAAIAQSDLNFDEILSLIR